ncbi:NUDIX hydrolase [Aquabacter spiritensis]|uniref:NrtR DNA-binding winged helix domain-containing protein n=1 Tax=Aquabacter spiritensis TaxID=933073 RepID=A0A4R3LY56_9HYPH|nr:hypothetical protein [Aquabacter spiritensis]TCT05600.1 hypothetical protein EDC64_104157 [Aquabacter spiritensis]
MADPPHRLPAFGSEPGVSIDLSAAVVAVTAEQPRVLALYGGERPALPSGPLEAAHRTLEAGLRSWVERQTNQKLNYVEQLYTFGDLDRHDAGARALSVAYLALVREARPAGEIEAAWLDWYGCFPWEDWRAGRPAVLDAVDIALEAWTRAAPDAKSAEIRRQRRRLAFGEGLTWNDERVLERYELLYEAGLVQEAVEDGAAPALGRAMAFDHRRILATAIGRLRGKIKYRPVVFELMPPAFTLLQLQLAVEALSGMRLHKQNFRRLVESQGLVEETGGSVTGTGRPARLVRFRREVLIERPAPGVRPTGVRRG